MTAKYHDLPMDLADPSLVAAAARLESRRVFSLDGGLRVARPEDGPTPEAFP